MGWPKVALERKGPGVGEGLLDRFQVRTLLKSNFVSPHTRVTISFRENNSSFRPTASNPRREILPHSVRYAHSNRQNPTHSSLRSECYRKWFSLFWRLERRGEAEEWNEECFLNETGLYFIVLSRGRVVGRVRVHTYMHVRSRKQRETTCA